MGVSKVIYGGNPIIDISDSTVTAESLEAGKIAYGANGERITGTAELKNQNNIVAYCNSDGLYPELAGVSSGIKIFGGSNGVIYHGDKFITHGQINGSTSSLYYKLDSSGITSDTYIYFEKTNAIYSVNSSGRVCLNGYMVKKEDKSSQIVKYNMNKGQSTAGILVTKSIEFDISPNANLRAIPTTSNMVNNVSGSVNIFGYGKKEIGEEEFGGIIAYYAFNGHTVERYLYTKSTVNNSGTGYIIDGISFGLSYSYFNRVFTLLKDFSTPLTNVNYFVNENGLISGIPINDILYKDKNEINFSELDIVVIPE